MQEVVGPGMPIESRASAALRAAICTPPRTDRHSEPGEQEVKSVIGTAEGDMSIVNDATSVVSPPHEDSEREGTGGTPRLE